MFDTRRLRVPNPVLAVLVGVCTLLLLLSSIIADWLRGGTQGLRLAAYHLGAYNRTIIIPDFFEDGLVRRGLPGTIAHLISPDYVWGGVGFTIVSALYAAVPVGALTLHLARKATPARAAFLAAVFLLAPHTLRAWAHDGGRTDVFVVGSLAWVALAGVHGRYRLAALAVVVGLFAHEAVVFYGVSLIGMMMWHDRQSGRLSTREALANAAVLGGGLLLAVAAQHAFSADPATVARRMVAVAPRFTVPLEATLRDIAIYFATAEGRGIRTAMCWNFIYNRQFLPLLALCLGTLALYCPILLMWRWRWTFVAVTVVPILLLSIVANDVGRWLMFAVANAWLMAVFVHARTPEPPGRTAYAVACIIFAALLFTGTGNPFAPNYGSQRLVARLGFPPPSFDGWMARCDPDWRDLTGGANPAGS